MDFFYLVIMNINLVEKMVKKCNKCINFRLKVKIVFVI